MYLFGEFYVSFVCVKFPLNQHGEWKQIPEVTLVKFLVIPVRNSQFPAGFFVLFIPAEHCQSSFPEEHSQSCWSSRIVLGRGGELNP